MIEQKVKISGSGTYLPGLPIAFDDVDYYLGKLTDAHQKIQKWMSRIKPVMKEMIGIDYYHYAIDPVTREFTGDNVTMSVKAAEEALKASKLKPSDIELIVYGGAQMNQMPTASVRIQEELGIEHCAEIGVHANCTSAYKALMIAYDMLKCGRYKTALVLSSSMSSSELRAEYYNQPLVKKEELFLRYFLCDGAGALVLEADSSSEKGLFIDHVYIESIGGNMPSAMMNKRPAYFLNPKLEFEQGLHHLSQLFQDQLAVNFHQEGGSVFYHGLKRMLEKFPIDLEKVKYFQVNFPSSHIADLVMDECEQLGLNRNTLYTKMKSMGYVGPPMVFICIDKILREEHCVKGDIILSFVTEVSKFMQAGFSLQIK